MMSAGKSFVGDIIISLASRRMRSMPAKPQLQGVKDLSMSIHEPLSAPAEAPTALHPRFYPFSVAQYHQMAEKGILSAGDRVELLDGRIVMMSPIGPPHRRGVQRLTKLLASRLPADWELMVQQPITLAHSEPQPDLSVVSAAAAGRSDRHPVSGEIALVVEVADSTLALDRRVKLPIYAEANVPEYWIVNVVDRRVEVYRQPTFVAAPGPVAQATYASRQDVIEPDELALTLDGRLVATFAVAEIFA
jgi:Uma2 family endonuclease